MSFLRITKRWPLLAATALLFGVFGCSGDGGVEEPEPPPPLVVSGLSTTSASPGDTITVTGSGFSVSASGNQIRFSNPLAVVTAFSSNESSMRVVVPNDAATGKITVTVAGQSATGPVIAITRDIGDVWVFSGATDTLKVPYPTPTTRHLLVPYGANPGVNTVINLAYTIDAGTSPAFPSPPPAAVTPSKPLPLRERFEAYRWAELERLRPGLEVRPAVQKAPAAPADFRDFFVLASTSGSAGDPANFMQVTAQLRYDGTHCLIYTDVDTLASAADNLSQADLNNLGQTFDTQIQPTNTTNFGDESDIDQNGKVIILVTPVVNRLTPAGTGSFIAGFFLFVDLFAPGSGTPPGTTNQAEIFYVFAADPDGVWSNKYSTSFVASENIQTIAHEYEHLISFSYRLFHYGLAFTQQTWLEEGMAHIAEDLNGFNDSNVARANTYLADPGGVSLEYDVSPITQRGGIYLFLRYLGDRFGNGIFETLVQSQCVGRSCIENITGESFYDTLADFFATLYLSGKGITADPKYNYTSIDLDDFSPVAVTNRSVGGPVTSGSVLRSAGDFYSFGNTATPGATFRITADLPMAGLRTVVVRIQ